jgi:tryptophan synthase alpha chain
LPDLPVYEYEQLYARYFKDNHLSNVFMVTPQTSEERIRKIDALSNSFIYLLSAASVTGVSLKLNNALDQYFARIKAMQLNNPTIVGFGIGDKLSFERACHFNRGAIVGTAFVKHTATPNYLATIPDFIKTIR